MQTFVVEKVPGKHFLKQFNLFIINLMLWKINFQFNFVQYENNKYGIGKKKKSCVLKVPLLFLRGLRIKDRSIDCSEE